MVGKSSAATSDVRREPEQHTTSMDEVHTWSVQSPYSPLNLQHLPQPTPRDAPRAYEGRFTFKDAFEDLLVAGSGQPLPSMRELAWKKTREAFPFWAEHGVHVAHWVGGLEALGLWDAYFRLEPGSMGLMGKGEDMRRRLYFRQGGPLGGPMREGTWGNWEGWPERATGVNRSSFDAKGAWGAAWKVGQGRDRCRDDGNTDEANVEDELYGVSASDHVTDEVSRLGSKSQQGLGERIEKSGLSKLPAPGITTTVFADGSKHVKKTERSERGGKTEVTTTSQRFDPAGNLISESREISITRTWSGSVPGAEASFSWSWNGDSGTHGRSTGDDGHQGRREDHGSWENRKDEKKGWFWNW